MALTLDHGPVLLLLRVDITYSATESIVKAAAALRPGRGREQGCTRLDRRLKRAPVDDNQPAVHEAVMAPSRRDSSAMATQPHAPCTPTRP